MFTIRRDWTAALALVSVLAAAACTETTGVEEGASVQLSVHVPAVAGPAAARAALVPVTDDAGNTLDIQQVQVVLEEVELEQEGEDLDDDCDSSGPGNQCPEDDDDEFEAGPVLVELPVDGGVVRALEGAVPPGAYDELEFEVDRPDDDGSGDAFRAANPGWPENASIRVRGTFDTGSGAQAFDVFLNIEAEMELELDTPIVIEADSAGGGGTINVTLSIDVNRWFLDGDDLLIDPRALAADGGLRERVRANVRASFHAFEDDDRDGHDDEDHSGHG